MSSAADRSDPEDFSLVLGGPLYQFCLRTRLARPPLKLLHRRIAALTLLTWLPLLVLTTIAGTVVHGVRVPFLFDLDVHARLLISLTLLVSAEPFVHQLLAATVRQLKDRELIAAEERALPQDCVRHNAVAKFRTSGNRRADDCSARGEVAWKGTRGRPR